MTLEKQSGSCRPAGGGVCGAADEACGGDGRSAARVRLHKMVRIRLVAEAGMPAQPSPFTACMTEVSPTGATLLAGRAIQTGAEFRLTVRDAEGPVTELLYRALGCEHVSRSHYRIGAELVRVLRPKAGATSGATPAAAADVPRIVASCRMAG